MWGAWQVCGGASKLGARVDEQLPMHRGGKWPVLCADTHAAGGSREGSGGGPPRGGGGPPRPRGRGRGGRHPGAGQDALPEGGGEGGGHLLPAEVLPRHAHRAAHPVLAPAEDAVHAPPDGPTARRSHGRGPPTPGVDPV